MSQQTTSLLTNYGQTSINTSKPSTTNQPTSTTSSSSILNALIFEHAMGGMQIASSLPKQTHGQTNISGAQNMRPTQLPATKSKLTPFEAKLLAQAKAAAEKKAAQEKAEEIGRAHV